MTEEVKVEPKEEEVKDVSINEHDGLSHLSEEDKKRVVELREENAKRRHRAKELEKELNEYKEEQQKIKEEKLKEDGKLQELLDAKQKEIDELKGLKETNEEYENTFKEQLEAIRKKLTKQQIDLIDDSGWTISKQLKWALQMSENNKSLNDGPGSERPGGDIVPKNIDLNEYRGPKGRIKLASLKSADLKKYNIIMEML
jgi:chromosome segregation ATPase